MILTFFILGTDYIPLNTSVTFSTSPMDVGYVILEIPAAATVGSSFVVLIEITTTVFADNTPAVVVTIAANGTYVYC